MWAYSSQAPWPSYRHTSGVRQATSSPRERAELQRVQSDNTSATLFPAGQLRAEIQVPGAVLLLSSGQYELSEVSQAVAAGCTVFVLEGDDAGALYQESLALKTALRGRATLLIRERTDIASASGADGALLAESGLPTAVARASLSGSTATGSTSQVVARLVSSEDSAVRAAKDGADLVILDSRDSSASPGDVVAKITKQISIPVFPLADGDTATTPTELLEAGADGIALAWEERNSFANRTFKEVVSVWRDSYEADPTIETETSSELPSLQDEALPCALSVTLGEQAQCMIDAERKALLELQDFLLSTTPEMIELGLLNDSIKQLDELFLVVVVGEFNAGKSTLINAMLGARLLKEGILPTTNEVTLLEYAERAKAERKSDGQFVRYLPAELLRNIRIVDTPGTNVVLSRQQQLTEEFLPRADLVLYVMSADRPFTSSEVDFLQYIRKWGKKIIFVINKADLLPEPDQISEVIQFVQGNAERILQVEDSPIFPVSARDALSHKTKHGGKAVANDSQWTQAGFAELEGFLSDFLSDEAGEGIRLKLDTPLALASALCNNSKLALEKKIAGANSEAGAIAAISDNMKQLSQEIGTESADQRRNVKDILKTVSQRLELVIDNKVSPENWGGLAQYSRDIFKSADAARQSSTGLRSVVVDKSMRKLVVGQIETELQESVQEHGEWVKSNATQQAQYYGKFLMERLQKWEERFGEQSALLKTLANADVLDGLRELEAGPDFSREGAPLVTSVESKLDSMLTSVEEDVRGAVLLTTRLALGGAFLAVILLARGDSFLDELIALLATGGIAYGGLFSFRLQREAVKSNARKVVESLVADIDSMMERQQQQIMESTVQAINASAMPFEAAMRAELQRLREAKEKRAEIAEGIGTLRQAVQRMGAD